MHPSIVQVLKHQIRDDGRNLATVQENSFDSVYLPAQKEGGTNRATRQKTQQSNETFVNTKLSASSGLLNDTLFLQDQHQQAATFDNRGLLGGIPPGAQQPRMRRHQQDLDLDLNKRRKWAEIYESATTSEDITEYNTAVAMQAQYQRQSFDLKPASSAPMQRERQETLKNQQQPADHIQKNLAYLRKQTNKDQPPQQSNRQYIKIKQTKKPLGSNLGPGPAAKGSLANNKAQSRYFQHRHQSHGGHGPSLIKRQDDVLLNSEHYKALLAKPSLSPIMQKQNLTQSSGQSIKDDVNNIYEINSLFSQLNQMKDHLIQKKIQHHLQLHQNRSINEYMYNEQQILNNETMLKGSAKKTETSIDPKVAAEQYQLFRYFSKQRNIDKEFNPKKKLVMNQPRSVTTMDLMSSEIDTPSFGGYSVQQRLSSVLAVQQSNSQSQGKILRADVDRKTQQFGKKLQEIKAMKLKPSAGINDSFPRRDVLPVIQITSKRGGDGISDKSGSIERVREMAGPGVFPTTDQDKITRPTLVKSEFKSVKRDIIEDLQAPEPPMLLEDQTDQGLLMDNANFRLDTGTELTLATDRVDTSGGHTTNRTPEIAKNRKKSGNTHGQMKFYDNSNQQHNYDIISPPLFGVIQSRRQRLESHTARQKTQQNLKNAVQNTDYRNFSSLAGIYPVNVVSNDAKSLAQTLREDNEYLQQNDDKMNSKYFSSERRSHVLPILNKQLQHPHPHQQPSGIRNHPLPPHQHQSHQNLLFKDEHHQQLRLGSRSQSVEEQEAQSKLKETFHQLQKHYKAYFPLQGDKETHSHQHLMKLVQQEINKDIQRQQRSLNIQRGAADNHWFNEESSRLQWGGVLQPNAQQLDSLMAKHGLLNTDRSDSIPGELASIIRGGTTSVPSDRRQVNQKSIYIRRKNYNTEHFRPKNNIGSKGPRSQRTHAIVKDKYGSASAQKTTNTALGLATGNSNLVVKESAGTQSYAQLGLKTKSKNQSSFDQLRELQKSESSLDRDRIFMKEQGVTPTNFTNQRKTEAGLDVTPGQISAAKILKHDQSISTSDIDDDSKSTPSKIELVQKMRKSISKFIVEPEAATIDDKQQQQNIKIQMVSDTTVPAATGSNSKDKSSKSKPQHHSPNVIQLKIINQSDCIMDGHANFLQEDLQRVVQQQSLESEIQQRKTASATGHINELTSQPQNLEKGFQNDRNQMIHIQNQKTQGLAAAAPLNGRISQKKTFKSIPKEPLCIDSVEFQRKRKNSPQKGGATGATDQSATVLGGGSGSHAFTQRIRGNFNTNVQPQDSSEMSKSFHRSSDTPEKLKRMTNKGGGKFTSSTPQISGMHSPKFTIHRLEAVSKQEQIKVLNQRQSRGGAGGKEGRDGSSNLQGFDQSGQQIFNIRQLDAEQIVLNGESYPNYASSNHFHLKPQQMVSSYDPTTRNLQDSSGLDYGQQNHNTRDRVNQGTQITATQSLRNSGSSRSQFTKTPDLRGAHEKSTPVKETPRTHAVDPQISQVISFKDIDTQLLPSADHMSHSHEYQMNYDMLQSADHQQNHKKNTLFNKNRIMIEMKNYKQQQSTAVRKSQEGSNNLTSSRGKKSTLNLIRSKPHYADEKREMSTLQNKGKGRHNDDKPSSLLTLKKDSEIMSVNLDAKYDKKAVAALMDDLPQYGTPDRKIQQLAPQMQYKLPNFQNVSIPRKVARKEELPLTTGQRGEKGSRIESEQDSNKVVEHQKMSDYRDQDQAGSSEQFFDMIQSRQVFGQNSFSKHKLIDSSYTKEDSAEKKLSSGSEQQQRTRISKQRTKKKESIAGPSKFNQDFNALRKFMHEPVAVSAQYVINDENNESKKLLLQNKPMTESSPVLPFSDQSIQELVNETANSREDDLRLEVAPMSTESQNHRSMMETKTIELSKDEDSNDDLEQWQHAQENFQSVQLEIKEVESPPYNFINQRKSRKITLKSKRK